MTYPPRRHSERVSDPESSAEAARGVAEKTMSLKNHLPQPGNPHGLSVHQHIFPLKSISRFSNNKNGVDTFITKNFMRKNLAPSNKLFTFTRKWDQLAEDNIKKIEDRFQEIAEKIIVRNATNLKPTEQNTLTEFYLSWTLRANLPPIRDQQIKGMLGPARTISTDHYEQMERAGILTIRDDRIIPGYKLAWMRMRLIMDREIQTGRYDRWGILISENYEFCCAERPAVDSIPLSPRQLLFLNADDQIIKEGTVRDYNEKTSKVSGIYLFAHDLDQCAGIGALPNNSKT